MLSCFTRVHLYLYHSGFITEGTVIFQKKSMMQNFLNYIRLEGEQTFSILEELRQLKFKKKRTLLSNAIRYSLLLRYNYLQTYQLLMKDFPFPSLSPLKKSTEGKLDAVKCPKSLKSKVVISEDIVLMFHEMYLQKCEECCGGEIIGANENNELRITRIYNHRIKRKCPLNYQIYSRAKY